MDHPCHEHSLILNENYIAREGDVCRGCSEQIFSCKFFVYSCSRITGNTSTDASLVNNVSCAKFLLHKSCAELPARIQKPTHPNKFLRLYFNYSLIQAQIARRFSIDIANCDICGIRIPWQPKQFYYSSLNFYVCLKCFLFQTQQSLEDPKLNHPAHPQHPLSLIQHPSSFKCYACNVDDNIKDMSYRCTKCQFWMHKSCADAPTSFQFQFHDKHPLTLTFSLPQVYHKYAQHCRLCNETLSRLVWLYCCFKCRFFAHFQCARSLNGIQNSSENEKYDSNVVQLPGADESAVNLLREKFIKAAGIQNNNNDGILSSINGIKHWTHEEHHLQLINGYNDLKYQQDVDEILLLCDGCVKPIRTDDDQFYGCVTCKYFLHKFCAELPKEIKDHLTLDMRGYAIANRDSKPYNLFYCFGCNVLCNGILFDLGDYRILHIGCMTLPKIIKHEAHRHILTHVLFSNYKRCKACGTIIRLGYECEQCNYHICNSCIMKARVANHPWDLHPLRLIYEPGMVIDDHEHDFNCEYCSKDIDTNYWFYHCSDCDLSLHLGYCFEKSSYPRYSNVKFGATDIIIDKLHPHSLTFVLNKKFRRCQKCNENQLGEPVLECAGACRSVFCRDCAALCVS